MSSVDDKSEKVIHYRVRGEAYSEEHKKIVEEYQKIDHSEKENTLEVDGNTIMVLNRGLITGFYNKRGDTLFGVENERLEAEKSEADEVDAGEPESAIGKAISAIERQAFDAAIAPEAEELVPQADVKDEETHSAEKANAVDVKVQARQKLEQELKNAKDNAFADPIIKYLLSRCEEDDGLAEDVVQEHKSWSKCFDYIFSKARESAKGSRSAAVRDDVVFEWAEDYFHKDDKAEKAAKTKKTADQKKAATKNQKPVSGKKKPDKPEPKKTDTETDHAEKEKPVEKKESAKPKRKSKDMEGQLDLFSMMGL
jgi:hypothetical protein